MVQMEGHGFFEDHEYSRPELSSGQTQKYGLEDFEKTSKQDVDMDFDPAAPYSSSMDDVPLKVLFGVPHVKMRQGPLQEKKTVPMDKTSPKGQADSSDSVRRSILRESLASALAMVGDEQHKKDIVREKDLQAEMVVSERHLNAEFQVVETDQTDCKPVTDKYCDKEESPKTLKREREDIEWKQELAEAPVSSQGCLTGGLEESDLYLATGDVPENCTFKRIKLDREETREEINQRAMEVYEAVAIQIEAELFRIYGGVNKKYREKARSLTFNLKDKNNPELRARVVSGEISPNSLCRMSAQQLASKELSQWRIAKAEQLALMVVLPDSDVDFRRLVKKTHKGEFQVEVENDDASLEVVAGEGHLMSTSQVKQEHAETNQVANVDQVIDKIDKTDPNEIVEGYPTHLSPRNLSGQAVGETVTDMGTTEVVTAEGSKERKLLPEIVSLDDYIGSWGDQSNEDVGADMFHMEGPMQWPTTDLCMLASEEMDPGFKDGPLTNTDCVTGEKIGVGNESASDKIKCPNWVDELQVGKTFELSHGEKLWEGILQLSVNAMVTVTAFFKSGEKVSANDWSNFVEIKGRVRLDAFEKFLQELPLSRSRALMVVSFCCKDGSPENGLASMQEFADSYKQGDRVGFAEPAPGTELYLCPYDSTTLKMLSKFDSCKNLEIINEEDGLIGCVVWRRNNVASNVTPKMPEKYTNAKQLALSGHLLDSPTRAGVPESISCGADSPKLDTRDHFEQYSVKSRGQTIESGPKSVEEVKDGVCNANHIQRQFCHTLDADLPPGFSSWPPSTTLCDPRTDAPKVVHSSVIDDDLIEDIPPGFGPKPVVMRNNVSAQDQLTNLDDDDLPEFDYEGVSVTSQPSVNRVLAQNINLQSSSPSESCGQLSPAQASPICNPGYFQPDVPLISPQSHLAGHQNVQHVPRPPTTPHPSMQIRELIQKFGQGEAAVPFSSGSSCFPDSPRVNTASHIGQQAGCPAHMPGNTQTLLPSSHVAEEKRWNDEDDIPEWHPPYLQPGNGPVPLMPPVGTELRPQLGMPNFVGNIPSVHPTLPRVPPPLRVPSQSAPLIPPLPRGPPPLPRAPPPSIGMAQPIPMLVTQGNHGLMHATNYVTFHPSHNFRPAMSGPGYRPLDARNGRF